MKIIQGRGNSRRLLIDVPDGRVVKGSPPEMQRALTEFVSDSIGLTAHSAPDIGPGVDHNSVRETSSLVNQIIKA